MRIAEMEVHKGENVMKYQDEIKARPKCAWFAPEQENTAAKGVPSSLILSSFKEKARPLPNGLPVSKKLKNNKRKTLRLRRWDGYTSKLRLNEELKQIKKQNTGKVKAVKGKQKSAVTGKRKGNPKGGKEAICKSISGSSSEYNLAPFSALMHNFQVC